MVPDYRYRTYIMVGTTGYYYVRTIVLVGETHVLGLAAAMDPLKYVRKDVLAMKAYTPGEQVNNCIKLNTNECAWGPSAAVLKAVAEINPDQLRLYPSPMCDRLRATAAEVFGVNASQVLVGNGSDDCLTVIMRSFVQPGDTVACPWPTYSLYDTLATIQGVEIIHVDWLQEPDPSLDSAASQGGVKGWHMPVEALAKSGARVVFVATPNNPSGERCARRVGLSSAHRGRRTLCTSV